MKKLFNKKRNGFLDPVTILLSFGVFFVGHLVCRAFDPPRPQLRQEIELVEQQRI